MADSDNMKPGLSPAQELIAYAPIDNTLVAAAAGSGKTRVLVSRIIDKLINREFSIDHVLVVTFTREAARQMREKIEAELRSKISELKGDDANKDVIDNLYRQLDLLPNSYIQTLDSFCSRVIKEKGYVCVDSKEGELLEQGSTILDENELKLLLRASASEAVEYTYLNNCSEEFLLLTAMYGNGRTDDSLIDSLVGTYSQLRSLPNYLERCDSILEFRKEMDSNRELISIKEVLDSLMVLYKRIDSDCLNNLRKYNGEIQYLASGNKKRQGAFADLYDAVEDYVTNVVTKYDSGATTEDIINAIQDDKFLSSITKDIVNGAKLNPANNDIKLISDFGYEFGKVAALLIILNERLSLWSRKPAGFSDLSMPYNVSLDYSLLLKKSFDDLVEDQIKRTAIIESYISLVKLVDQKYLEQKTRVHGMDFPDQTHLAMKILSFDEAQQYYCKKFDEIYIDEYQDNSEIQDAVIDKISNQNVFRVGDVKQSIYKFRYAEPSLFMKKMNSYFEVKTSADYSIDSVGKLYLLNCNYRSDSKVLAFVNHIFESIMTEEGAEIEYDSKQQLNFPDTKSSDGEVPPRVVLVNQPDYRKEKEAMLYGVVNEVKRLKADNPDLKDICVLTRSCKFASLVSKRLISEGFDAYYADELSVFDDNDIHSICNMIIAIGNSYRNEHLMSVLLSPYRFSNFTLNEVAMIIDCANKSNKAMKNQPLIEKLRCFISVSESSELRDRVARFLDLFDSFRNDQIITDIGEVVDRIYSESGIVTTLKDDSAKLVMFKDWICDSFIRYGSDISKIAQELENMNVRLGSASVRKKAKADEGVIKCMTYHSSKGLENEAIIVTELYSRGKKDNASNVLFDANSGFVSNDYSEEHIRRDESLENICFSDKKLIAENAENLRLLYVALTRAKKHLSVVLSGNLANKRYGLIYNMVLSNKADKFGRSHWLNGNKSIEYAFMSGLLKLKGASVLNSKLKETIDPDSDRYISCSSNYDDFIVDILSVDSSLLDVDDDADSEDVDDDEASLDDVSPVTVHGDNLIPVWSQVVNDDGSIGPGDYEYENSSKTPFKLSVSAIKENEISDSLPVNITVNGYEYFKARMNGDVGETPSELGTFLHRVMRFIDFERISLDVNSFEDEIDDLIEANIIKAGDREKALMFKPGIIAFAKSDIGARYIASENNGLAEYEKPILFAVDSGALNEDLIEIQGVIDLLFKENDGFVLVDYKTDRFDKSFDADMRAQEAILRHKNQIEYYSLAAEVSGYNIKERYLYLVNYGEFVCVSREAL